MGHSDAVVQRCSVKKVFLEISKNSQKNTCAGVSFLKGWATFLSNIFLVNESHGN